MAYKESVIIDIDVQGIDLGDLGKLQTSLAAVATQIEALESLDEGQLDNINKSFTGLARTINEAPDIDDPFENVNLGVDNINKKTGNITNNVRDIRDELSGKISFTPELDDENLAENFADDLSEQLEVKNVRLPVRPQPEIDTPSRNEIQESAKRYINQFQDVINDMDDDDLIDFSNVIGQIDQGSLEELEEVSQRVQEAKAGVTGANKDLKTANEQTALATDKETRSLAELMEEATTLSEAKDAVSRANRKVGDEAGRTRREVIEESKAFNGLSATAQQKLLRTLDDVESRNRVVGRGLRKLRRSTDEVGDSMYAAARVSELFEDGLGTLSLNLGAFTIGLRNFLTQIPMLLIGLGALAVSVISVASAFVTMAAAMASVAGAGLLVHLQDIESSMSDVENMGEAMKIVMEQMREVFISAVSPLTESGYALEFFERSVNGAAAAVNILSQSFAQLIEGSESVEALRDAGQEVYTLNEAFDDFGDVIGGEGGSWQAFTNSLAYSFLLLGERMVHGLDIAIRAISKAIKFSSDLYSRTEDIMSFFDRFTDMAAEMAELGMKIGGGLVPVFEAFIAVVESVGERLNTLDGQMAQNLITFLALIAVADKMAGAFGSFISVVPNIAMSLGRVYDSTEATTGAIKRMRAAFVQSSVELSGFVKGTNLLPGLFGINDAILGTSQRFRQLAFGADEAQAAFGILAEGSSATTDELEKAAIVGDLFEDDGKTISGVDFDIDGDAISELNKDAKATLDLDKLSPDVPFLTKVFGTETDIKESLSNMDLIRSKFRGLQQSLQESTSRIGRFGAGIMSISTRPVTYLTETVQEARKGIAAALAFISAKVATSENAVVKGMANIARSFYATYIAALPLSATLGAMILTTAILGGLVAGAIVHFDGLKTAISGAFKFLKQLVGIFVDSSIRYFVTTFNYLVDIFEALRFAFAGVTAALGPITQAFAVFGGEAGATGGVLNGIQAVLDVTFSIFKALGYVVTRLIDVFAVLLRVALMPLSVILTVISHIILGMAAGFNRLMEALQNSAALKATVSAFESMAESLSKLMNMFGKFKRLSPSNLRVFDPPSGAGSPQIENAIGFAPASLEQSAEESLKISREELGASAGDVRESVAQKAPKFLSFNTDKSTNIDQEINADPDDETTLSRAVERAIEQANNAARRRQGL